MSKCQVAYTFVLTAVLGCCLGDIAFAHGGYFGGFGFNDGYITTDRRPPYFAEYPPVHYSYVVPRTYGYSPYAYRGNVRTPNPRSSRSLVLKNRYVKNRSKAAANRAMDKTASITQPVKPLVLDNPFVLNDKSVAKN